MLLLLLLLLLGMVCRATAARIGGIGPQRHTLVLVVVVVVAELGQVLLYATNTHWACRRCLKTTECVVVNRLRPS
jgi:hypothetical protein